MTIICIRRTVSEPETKIKANQILTHSYNPFHITTHFKLHFISCLRCSYKSWNEPTPHSTTPFISFNPKKRKLRETSKFVWDDFTNVVAVFSCKSYKLVFFHIPVNFCKRSFLGKINNLKKGGREMGFYFYVVENGQLGEFFFHRGGSFPEFAGRLARSNCFQASRSHFLMRKTFYL